MQQNFQSTKLPTVGASSPIGGASAWSNPSRITADDGSSATWGAFAGGQHSQITGSVFDFQQLPDNAVIDGISVFIDGSQTSAMGDIALSVAGTAWKPIGALNGSYGGATDLWGEDVITPAQIAALTVTATVSDVSGGDAIASIDYMSVTVFWHIEMPNVPTDVPTRVAYKVYSKEGNYLGLLPKVASKFGFSQDLNSAGSTIQITCGKFVQNETTAEPILDSDGLPILDNNDLPIMGRTTDLVVAPGDSDDQVIFKNGNRVKVFLYNSWYPNGELMFSGQINNVSFKYGNGDSSVTLTVYSDGIDLDNYIARGYPFAYTTDVSQTTNNLYAIAHNFGGKGGGWEYYGQSFKTGAIDNIGAISLLIQGSADVTVSLFDGPNGNLLGQVTKSVAYGGATLEQFEFPQLIPVSPNTTYFFGVFLGSGQDLYMWYNNPSVYADGSMYGSSYSGGSGGGSWFTLAGDLYFITKSGVPTTTTTYSTDDPVSEMMHGILLDYNARGGRIIERDFTATGLSLTYKFNQSTIFDALKKVLEMSPNGYYSYIDLGTAELDILQASTTPDFTITRGKDINQLTITMSIEQVKNYLLLSGGEVTPGVNLFRQYTDNESIADYGVRMGSKADNRITQTATADAIGNSFIEENASETHLTQVTVLNSKFNIALLTPGKTIGFKNFGNFIDDLVLQIARRDFNPEAATLTLGRLPIRTNDEVQRLTRELLFEQTIDNPTAPS